MNRRYNEVGIGEFFMHEKNPCFIGLGLIKKFEPLNTLVYNGNLSQKVSIDGIQYTFPKNTILPLIVNHNFIFEYPEQLIAWQFNREFYCILENDSEAGSIGFLFYGIIHPMFIKLDSTTDQEIRDLIKKFHAEWDAKDSFQGEMLRTLLKHLIIKISRAAKHQTESHLNFKDDKLDIIRRLHLLVELNYKKEHSLKFYADCLNKSSKTLSNNFSILKQQTPLNIIHNRIILEAKRYLINSDKTVKEIAFELGFEDASNFSRFFKRNTGKNISTYKTDYVEKD